MKQYVQKLVLVITSFLLFMQIFACGSQAERFENALDVYIFINTTDEKIMPTMKLYDDVYNGLKKDNLPILITKFENSTNSLEAQIVIATLIIQIDCEDTRKQYLMFMEENIFEIDNRLLHVYAVNTFRFFFIYPSEEFQKKYIDYLMQQPRVFPGTLSSLFAVYRNTLAHNNGFHAPYGSIEFTNKTGYELLFMSTNENETLTNRLIALKMLTLNYNKFIDEIVQEMNSN